ncbi:MAG: ATP-binding protein [Candidatus Cloacimonetes bacterium]|nr:ATP-binding protein [Candidatus Cloacimonadota bacterium]
MYRKNRKIYLLDPFIYNAISAKVYGFMHKPFTYSKEQILTPTKKPALVENTTALSLAEKYSKLYFGQSPKHEIDFVSFHEGKYEYFEVKYQKEVKEEEFSWTKDLVGKAPFFVLTQKTFGENRISFIPAEVFLSSQFFQTQ